MEAKPHQLELAHAILVKGNFSSVVAVTVGLHHQSLLTPEEVGEIDADANVDLRTWQSMATTEREEVALKVTAGSFGSIPFLDRQPEDVCLPDCFAQLPGGDPPTLPTRSRPPQVGDRPGGRRHRNPLPKGDVRGIKSKRAVHPDPLSSRASPDPFDDDLGATIPHRQELPKRRSASVTEGRSPPLQNGLPARMRAAPHRKYRSEPLALYRQSHMAHRVDTTMNAVKAPDENPSSCRVVAYPGFPKLPR